MSDRTKFVECTERVKPAERREGSGATPGVVKARVSGALLASIVLLLFGIANLPFTYVETEVEWVGQFEVTNGGSYRTHQELPVMAGWPLRYWVRYVDGDVVQDRQWLPVMLAINLSLAMLIAAGVYLFLQIRHRKLIEAPDSHGLRFFFDASVALAILLVPGSIFAWQYRTAAAHRQLANQLSPIGSCCLSTWLPASIDPHVPSGLKRKFLRLRQVHVFGPKQAIVEAVASLPTLSYLHCFGGTFDARPLQGLREHPHFCVLQLNGRSLSDSDLDAIAQLPWLNQLRLSRCGIDAKQLQRFDHLPLKYVDLSLTNLELTDLGTPGWASTVETLTLSRPADGKEGRLTVEGWPHLKELRVQRQSNHLNHAVFTLRLIDLPRLERLHIDRVQKHDLLIRNVPRLAEVEEEVADLRFVMDSNILIPGLPWVRSLEIDGADSLTRFGCFCRDLEHFSIHNAAGMRDLSLGSYLVNLMGEVTGQEVDAQRCQGWIEHLGRMSGPARVNLAFLPLTDCDLSPLAGNRRIRELNLDGTDALFRQVRQLAGMEQLENLSIRSTPLEDRDLEWLLDSFPSLEELAIDATSLVRFDLRGKSQLRIVRATAMEEMDELRIVDLPLLRTSIRITRSPGSLEIRNVPSLQGLAVEGPWPKNAVLEGLRDLEWFTGGGEGINDQVVNELLKCDTLDRLTLAYPSVSAETLRGIGNMKELTFLALPGAAITDEVVRDWNRLNTLWEVNLDDTRISVETIAWLSRMESLRRLSLNRVPLNEAACDALCELNQISELHLEGVPVSCDQLRRLLRRGSLETLDLSGWKLSDELVNMLCSEASELKHLVLRGSQVDRRTFQRLMDASPELFVDLGSPPEYLGADMLSELYERAGMLRREMSMGWRLMLRPRDDVYRKMSPNFSPLESEEQPPSDESLRLPPTYMSHISRQRYSP